MAHLNPYLSFSGNCREVLSFYHRCLGGELILQPFADTPLADQVPAESQQHIMHGVLTTANFTIMASDGGGMNAPLNVGNNVSLTLNCGSRVEINSLFAQLGEGGTVYDPLAEVFWGGTFGSLTDRFGTKWLFNFAHDTGK